MVDILDKIDGKLLGYLDANCRMAETELAKKIGRSKESVRYRMKKLEEQGIITRYFARINPAALGYQQYTVYFSLRFDETKNDALVQRFRGDPFVYWIGTADGHWNIGVTLLAASPAEFYSRLAVLISGYEEQITGKEILIPVDTTITHRAFLSNDAPYTYVMGNVSYAIDDKDKRILNALQMLGRLSLVDLHRRTKIAIPVIRTRMRTLEKNKVIINYGIGVNLRLLGYTTYRLMIGFQQNSPQMLAKLRAFVAKNEHFLFLVRSISRWDYELVLVARTYDEYLSVTQRFKEQFKENLVFFESITMRRTEIFPAKRMP